MKHCQICSAGRKNLNENNHAICGSITEDDLNVPPPFIALQNIIDLSLTSRIAYRLTGITHWLNTHSRLILEIQRLQTLPMCRHVKVKPRSLIFHNFQPVCFKTIAVAPI